MLLDVLVLLLILGFVGGGGWYTYRARSVEPDPGSPGFGHPMGLIVVIIVVLLLFGLLFGRHYPF